MASNTDKWMPEHTVKFQDEYGSQFGEAYDTVRTLSQYKKYMRADREFFEAMCKSMFKAGYLHGASYKLMGKKGMDAGLM